jgi:hypothetical protein
LQKLLAAHARDFLRIGQAIPACRHVCLTEAIRCFGPERGYAE